MSRFDQSTKFHHLTWVQELKPDHKTGIILGRIWPLDKAGWFWEWFYPEYEHGIVPTKNEATFEVDNRGNALIRASKDITTIVPKITMCVLMGVS